MNTPTCGEISCDECNARYAALTAERDQLRGALALGQQNCDDAYDDLRTERDAARARAERAEAAFADAKEECKNVRLKWHVVMGKCSAKEDAIIELDEELARLRARAERAEDNLAALEQCHDDNCRSVVKIAADLATEQARLDWLLLDVVSRFDDAYYTRATIDAKMKEGGK